MEATPAITSRLPYRHCAKCVNRIVLHAFSESHCLECGKVIICFNTLQTCSALSVPSN